MKALKTCLAVGVLSWLGGCGGDDGLSQTEAFAKIADTFCERAFACEDQASDPLPYANVAECTAAFEAILNEEGAALQASIDAGRISWNEADAAFCAGEISSAINGLTCEEFWSDDNGALENDDPRCEALGEGLVADGDACTIDDDCATSGSECIDLVCGQPQ
jgi:hypothetical protein